MKKISVLSVITSACLLLIIGYYYGLSKGGASTIRNICARVNQHFLDTAFRVNDSLKESTQADVPAERIYNDVQFIITNENFCQGTNFDILIYVFSAAANFAPRLAIRSTWGNKTVLKDDVKLVYVIGRASSAGIQKRIEEESKMFNDIVQGDFKDSYYGLGNKSITTWNWIRMYCHTAKVFMKADDDLAFDMERLIKTVHPYINKPRHLMCYFFEKSPVIRDKRNKFYVTQEEYPDKLYPDYCNGWGFLYTRDIVEEMCRYMLQTEMFKIADVWTTGLVMQKVQNLTRIQLKGLLGIYEPHRAVLHHVLPSSMKESTARVIKMRI